MHTGSSGTLIGWKSGQTTFVPLWDRMEGAWLRTLQDLQSKACAKMFKSLHEYLETTFYELLSSILFSVVINIIADVLYFVEAAVCRQLISARRPSRDSRYAAFLSIHCAYTLVAHTCVITVIPHMCIQINCTVLNGLPYCLVVYASATTSQFCNDLQ
jgi:hypothetical protein